jgi:hypothetical protein
VIPDRSIAEVLAALPGVRPRLGRKTAEALLQEAGLLPSPREALYPATDLREGRYGPFLVLYPAGARYLVEAYAAGRLPMERGRRPTAPAEWLVSFAALTDADLATREAAERVSFDVLEDAYWRWVRRECPHPRHSSEEHRWREETPFLHLGARYTRDRTVMRSNSGKTVVGGRTTFMGPGGAVFAGEPVTPNRRNDPEWNWGLGPD